jgi:vanillate O-demethylase monooxygenase subunit
MYPFKPGDFAPRNCWYVAAFSEDIRETLLPRWIVGEPVVLYRKDNGTAVAVGGRCPHRYYPLADSRRVGDDIQCGYHGITFGPDGLCKRVPSQSSVPGVYKIPSYPLVERGLWAFIWMGDRDLADESQIPGLEQIGYGLPGYRYEAFKTLSVKGRYQLLNDNLLDLTHLAYLHASSIGTEQNATVPDEKKVEERSIISERWIKGADCPPLLAQARNYGGKVNRLSGMRFVAPGFHAGVDDTFIADPGSPRDGEVINSVKVFHAVTPATRHSTTYYFAFGSSDESLMEFFRDALGPVLDEDVFATEAIESIVETSETLPPELMLRSDATAVEGRRLVQRMMDSERG